MSIKSNISNTKLEGEDDNAGKNWDDDDFEIPMLSPVSSVEVFGKRKISELVCDKGPVAGRTRKKMKPIALRTRSKSSSTSVVDIFEVNKIDKKRKKKKDKKYKDVNDVAEEWIGKIGCEKTHGDFAIDDLDQFTRKK